MSIPETAQTTTVAPHPPMERYWGGETKRGFVGRIFDETAGDYDRVEAMMALGHGSTYRREALARAGLTSGMRVLDVAVGTGLVSREAVTLSGKPENVVGLDPSIGMLQQARKSLSISLVRGVGEKLPIADSSFDFLSMGYALRHLSDLVSTFKEFNRVIKPGGRVCVLEITRPNGFVGRSLLRFYMKTLVPLLTRVTAKAKHSPLLWDYYWETIAACVRPETVVEALKNAGFVDVQHRTELGIFSEYTGRRPG